MPKFIPKTKTFVMPDLVDRFGAPFGNPPDGYVITYSALDGYYLPKPTAKILTITNPAITPYTVVSEDTVLLTHGGIATVNLPVTPVTGYNVFIKDFSGNAATSNITIASAASIDGAGTYVINTNFGTVHVVYNGTTWAILSKF